MAKTPDLESTIQPAQHLNIVFNVAEEGQLLDLRGTSIYDINSREKYFLVAQTQPPILKSMVGVSIEATFLWRSIPTDDPSRYAFHTIIRNLITDYNLSRGQRVQAAELAYPDYIYQRNLRFSYRVQPISDYPITLWLEGHENPFPIIDISEGGICFSYTKLPKGAVLKSGNKLSLILDFNGEKMIRLQGEIIRKFQKNEFPEINFIALKFLNLALNDIRIIAVAVRNTERIILRKRSGLEEL